MKKQSVNYLALCAVAVLVLAGIGCSSPVDDEVAEIMPWDRQPMSTYLFMGSSYIDSTFISRVDFDNFDNIYLIDRAKWTSQENFDATVDSILAVGGSAFPIAKRDVYRYAVDEAHKAGSNVLLTIASDAAYSSCDSLRRAKYVRALMQAVEYYGFDGVDVDWEADLPGNFDNHTALIEELRAGLDSLGTSDGRKYYVTTALSVLGRYPEEFSERFVKAIDWVNLMAYDAGGGVWGRRATHNTPLQLFADSINSNWGYVPREKIHLGLASYGFRYHGLTPGQPVAEGKTTYDYGYFVNYTSVAPMLYNNTSWRQEFDSIQKVYYFIDDKEPGFITCDTPETLMYKYELAADMGLGGTFWWEYSKDVVLDRNDGQKWAHTLVPDHKRVDYSKR